MASTNTTLNSYIAQIKEFGLINPKREIELAELIARENSDEARHELATSNLRLVITIAKSFQYSQLPFEDLVAEGNVGLLKAVDRFIPGKGAKFSSYSAWWIKQSIREFINRHKSTIRLPNQTQSKIRQVDKCSKELRIKLDRDPTHLEIAQELGMRESTIYKTILIAARRTLSLDQEISNDNSSHSIQDIIPDQSAAPPGEILEDQEVVNALYTQMSETLNPREKFIIELRFGLTGKAPQTLEQISKHLDRTRERVRQLQEEALIKLRRGLINVCG